MKKAFSLFGILAFVVAAASAQLPEKWTPGLVFPDPKPALREVEDRYAVPGFSDIVATQGKWTIMIVDGNTRMGLVPYYESPRMCAAPKFSPNGKRMAYYLMCEPGDVKNPESPIADAIVVVDVKTGKLLYRHTVRDFRLSADKKITWQDHNALTFDNQTWDLKTNTVSKSKI